MPSAAGCSLLKSAGMALIGVRLNILAALVAFGRTPCCRFVCQGTRLPRARAVQVRCPRIHTVMRRHSSGCLSRI
jgi:hypothetical protein